MNTDEFNKALVQNATSIPLEIQEYLLGNIGELQHRLRVLRYGELRWCESVLELLRWKELHEQ